MPDAWYSRVAYDAVGGLTVTASRYINGFQVESDEAYDGCWLVPFAGPRGPVTWTCNDFRIECSDRGAVLEAHGLRDGSGSAEFTADDMDFSFRDQVSVIECY